MPPIPTPHPEEVYITKKNPHEGYTIVQNKTGASPQSREKMLRSQPRRTQYFYNILLLIGLSLILYLFSSQLLSQGNEVPTSHGGGGGGKGSEIVAVLRMQESDNNNNINLKYSSLSSSEFKKTANTNTPQGQGEGEGVLEEGLKPIQIDDDDLNRDTRTTSQSQSQFQTGFGGLEGITMTTPKPGSQEDQSPTTTKDWLRMFSETAHKLYAMFSPDYLKEFRKWAVKQQRQAIAREMKGYKFQAGGKSNIKLDNLIMEKGGQPIRNVIFTTWRSGSTFLGETLDSHPGTFYHYEPLLHFGIKQVRSGDLAKEGLRVLNQLLNCNYTGLNDYMEYGKTHHWLYSHNTRVWQYCEKSYDVCWDPKFLSEMCKLFPFQSVKTVRMRLRLAKTLLENKKFNIRLLLLVRDPRGTMQSRNHRDWCPEDPDCYDPSKLCMDMVDDFNFAEKLRVQYPDRFLAIRYEDMSLSPYQSMQKIFHFFRLQYHPQVEKFLSSHTTENVGGVSSTFRDSKTAPFHWRNDFIGNFSLVNDIQNSCHAAMKLWGYNPVSDQDHLLSFNPLRRPPWEEMFVLNSTNTTALNEMYV